MKLAPLTFSDYRLNADGIVTHKDGDVLRWVNHRSTSSRVALMSDCKQRCYIKRSLLAKLGAAGSPIRINRKVKEGSYAVIAQIDIKTGSIINVHKSFESASVALGCGPREGCPAIKRVCVGKVKSVFGFGWEMLNHDEYSEWMKQQSEQFQEPLHVIQEPPVAESSTAISGYLTDDMLREWLKLLV